jgi:hypothetical protein
MSLDVKIRISFLFGMVSWERGIEFGCLGSKWWVCRLRLLGITILSQRQEVG